MQPAKPGSADKFLLNPTCPPAVTINPGFHMNILATSSDCWTTASRGHAADTSPGDLFALGEHLDSCKALQGRLFALHRPASMLHGFVAARFVTTVVVAAVLMGLNGWIY